MPDDTLISTLGLNLSASISVARELGDSELWWRDHQLWLAERGYMLRPRYRPGWKPSWKEGLDTLSMDFEDGQLQLHPNILDATRISDNIAVVLKRVEKSMYPHEVEICKYLSSEPLRSDPRNHCVPVLDDFAVPNESDVTIIVMPLLASCDTPRWATIGEVVSFCKQVVEGLHFMHEAHVAHRDCQKPNIMYDPRPIYPKMFHPRDPTRTTNFKRRAKHSTRTAHPVKYYFIDFGLSRRYAPEDGPPREHPIRGGDKSVPEFLGWKGELLDPFPTDIYYLGNMLRESALQRFSGLAFLKPLVEDMVQTDPSKRPTIQDVVRRFDNLVKALGQWTLRSRLMAVDEQPAFKLFRDLAHTFRTIRYIILRKPAIPLPS